MTDNSNYTDQEKRLAEEQKMKDGGEANKKTVEHQMET